MAGSYSINLENRQYIANIKYKVDKTQLNKLLQKAYQKYGNNIKLIKQSLRDFLYKQGKYNEILDALSDAYDKVLSKIYKEYSYKLYRRTRSKMLLLALKETIEWLSENKWNYIKIYDIIDRGQMLVTVRTFDMAIYAKKIGEMNVHNLYDRRAGILIMGNKGVGAVRRITVNVNYWSVTPSSLVEAMELGRQSSGIIRPHRDQPRFYLKSGDKKRKSLLIPIKKHGSEVIYIARAKSRYTPTKNHFNIIYEAKNVMRREYVKTYMWYLTRYLREKGFIAEKVGGY